MDEASEISSPTPAESSGIIQAAIREFGGRLALNQLEVAKALGLSVSTVRRLTRKGVLKAKRIPRERTRAKTEVGSLLYPVEEVWKWLHSPPETDAA